RNHAPFSSSGSASQSGEGAPSEASKQQRGTKRSRETEQSEGPNDDGEESARNTVEISALSYSAENTLLFACPYRKRNPRKYCVRDWGPCALTGHPSISRVKSHLY
ncbi:hypothetical protein L207DRAFT_459288, partial [Hyaloscypha variabilis F]